MKTQNTPVRVRLWHRDFWLIALASLLVTAAMYLQLPLLHAWLIDGAGLPPWQAGLSIGAAGAGALSVGCFCSWLIGRFRRNLVCARAIFAMAACLCVMSYVFREVPMDGTLLVPVVVVRFLMGAAFGLSQMVLFGAMVIDTSESFLRTEAGHHLATLARFGIALGPLLALGLLPSPGAGAVIVAGIVLAALAMLLVLMVRFPFRAPEEVAPKVSLDRFFSPHAARLALNLLPVTVAVGMVLSGGMAPLSCLMMVAGFVLALAAERFVFANADLKSEVPAGILLLAAALFLRVAERPEASLYFSPTLLGCAMGILGSRFLLFFLKLSDHCQRGTLQCTFLLTWEVGVHLGLALGYCLFPGDCGAMALCALALSALALALYLASTHRWYMANRNR